MPERLHGHARAARFRRRDEDLEAARGAAVGSNAAKRHNATAKGFIGSSQDLTAPSARGR